MTPFDIGLAGICVLFVLILIGMPIGFAMGLVGFVGCGIMRSWPFALFQLKTVPFSTFSDSYTMACLPLFVLMGELCFHAGISSELYMSVHYWLGRMRGGLAIATVGACAGFAAVSGSSAATVATMGTVALPEMEKYKYKPALATGSVAAGGGLGILIPPSVILVIYGLFADQSIGKLFLAGMLPGILQAVLFILTIIALCRLNSELGPPSRHYTLRQKLTSLKYALPVIILFLIVMGGIYMGVFTPTEAAGVGAFVAFMFALLRGKVTLQNLTASLVGTARTTCFILFIVMGAVIFGYFITLTRLPTTLAENLAGVELNRYVIMLGIMIMYIFLGCVMEGLSILLLTVPVVLPLVQKLGFDPIWFGVIMVTVIEMGLITPPVGINVFIIHGVARSVPMATIFVGILPFMIADVLHVVMLVIWPQIALFLPTLLK